jgi:hypothetical protein
MKGSLLTELGQYRRAQGNAHAYKALTEPPKGEAGNQLAGLISSCRGL